MAAARKEQTFRLVSPVRVDGVVYRDEVTCDPAKLAGLDHCIAREPEKEPEKEPEGGAQ